MRDTLQKLRVNLSHRFSVEGIQQLMNRRRDSDSDTSLSDAQLLVGSIDSASYFADLYERHVDAVLGFHYRRTGCAQTAADLTAETFAEAFDSRRRFRDLGVPAAAWLFTIARRQLNRFVRHEAVRTKYRRRFRVPSYALDSEDLERVDALVDFENLREELRRAIESLPDGQAEAVRLRVGEQLAYPEVADRLGCSEQAARARVSRGLIRLAELMEPQ